MRKRILWTAAVLAAILTAGCAAPASDGSGTEETDRPVQADGADIAPADEDRADETEEKENRMTNEAEGEKARPEVLTDGDGREYSASTLIVQLDPDTDEEAAEALAEKHGLEIVYLYRSFSSMAVRTAGPMTSGEMDALMAELEDEEAVLGVERDYITRLDDPVSPPELRG